jgi:hypothetical protein
LESSLHGRTDPEEHEVRQASQHLDFRRVADRIHDVAIAESGEQPRRESARSPFAAEQVSDVDQVFALRRKSASCGLLTNDVGKGMDGEPVVAQVGGNFALAGRIRAR